MSQIWLPDGADDPRSTEEQFLDLLLADDDLLRAEFDAIIATEGPGPPPNPPPNDHEKTDQEKTDQEKGR